MKSKLGYEPAVLLGLLMTVIAGIGQAIDAQQGSPFNVWKFVVAVLPLAAGLAIRFNVVSAQWIFDVVAKADTVDAALHQVANEVGVAPPLH
jgi:fucose permease